MSLSVLQVSAAYKPAYIYGGPVRSISHLCEELKAYGLSVKVLATTANGKKELNVTPGKEYILDGISVWYFNRWSKDHSQFSPGLLWKLFFMAPQNDVVHIQSWWNLVSVFSAFICILRNIRPVISIRGTLSDHTFNNRHQWGKKIFHSWFGRKLLSRSILHVTSEKEAIETAKAVPLARIVTIPNILDFPVQGERMVPVDPYHLKLLFVGRIDPVKNLEVLLETVLHQKGDIPLQLKIIGDGKKSYTGFLQQKYFDPDHIQWLGEVRGEEKYKLICEADILVLISHTENFGNVVVEALSQGVAVVVSKNVGMSSYIQKNNLGWVIDPTIASLTSCLEKISHERGTLEEIRKRAPFIISQNLNAAVLLEQYIRMYKDSITGKKQIPFIDRSN